MRILHVIRTLDPSHGGPPMVVTRIAAAQAAQGHEATILSYAHPGAEDRVRHALAGIPHMERVTVAHLPAAGRMELIAAFSARKGLPAFLRSCDVAHLHGVWPPLIKVAANAAHRLNVPYFIRPCGVLDAWCLEQKRLKKKIAMALGYRRMLRQATGIHALNADEARFIGMLELGCPIHIIPNGVFLEELDPLPAAGTFHDLHPELQRRAFILFLSRLHYKKGLDFLAGAFALIANKHADVHLVVAGPDEGAREDFQQRIAESRLQPRVHVVGPIYGPEKIAALVDAACFCLPSRQEGFSVAITEAIACGTPVVISEDCHFPEVAEAGAGEVVALSAEAVAEALDRMLSDPARRQRMGRAGRELARVRYTWPAIAGQTVAMYRSGMSD